MGCGVRAFSTTRHGGYSRGDYGQFNINRYCGDETEAIAQNRLLLSRLLGMSNADHIVMPHQTHQTEVRQITPQFFSSTEAEQAQFLEGVDALLTDQPGVCIGVSTADCVPILMYDSEHQAVCAVHAGWRGTAAGIARVAVATMQRTYGSRPEHLQLTIGPSISLENFEVGDEVYEAFRQAGFPMPLIAHRYPSRQEEGGERWHIDLWAANRWLLQQAGANVGHIHTAGICTYAHSDDYFSARQLGIRSGRIFTGIFLD